MDMTFFEVNSKGNCKETKEPLPRIDQQHQWSSSNQWPAGPIQLRKAGAHSHTSLPLLTLSHPIHESLATPSRLSYSPLHPFVPLVYLESDLSPLPHPPRKSLYGPNVPWQEVTTNSSCISESHSYVENVTYWNHYYATQAKWKLVQKRNEGWGFRKSGSFAGVGDKQSEFDHKGEQGKLLYQRRRVSEVGGDFLDCSVDGRDRGCQKQFFSHSVTHVNLAHLPMKITAGRMPDGLHMVKRRAPSQFSGLKRLISRKLH